MKDMHLKRWDFICSYKGITVVGAVIFALCFLVYMNICYVMGRTMTADTVLEYPGAFLKGTTPLLIIMTVFLMLCNANAVIKEGFRTRHLLGSAFGITCIIGSLICQRFLFTALAACYYECIFFGTVILRYAADGRDDPVLFPKVFRRYREFKVCIGIGLVPESKMPPFAIYRTKSVADHDLL